MEKKIGREIAEAEVSRWLDFKKVGIGKRKKQKASINVLIDAIKDGYLSLQDDFSFRHVLKFAIEEESPTSELTYKARTSVEVFQTQLLGVNPKDNYAIVTAYIAGLTKKPKGVIKKLDSEDYSIASSIVTFFM
jgi:hypothetical protein